ncbi:MAG TPA: hypothetical protein VFQ43_05915, partial [Nitrososphaera sp.]|nr:hypothetical protein [Nitrososphaera sp.]
QYIRSCGTPSPLSPVSGAGSFEVVPSMCVSERYDTNVFYVRPTPGLQRDDFVTHVEPLLRVIPKGDYATGFLNVGGFSETYVKNPHLNYLGTRDTLSLNLDNSIKRLLPNASLSVNDTFSYTPLPPGFVNPAAGTSPGDPGNIQDVFAQGFLFRRTNNVKNNATVSTSYATTASTSLQASYNNAIIRFYGARALQGGLNLFNATIQTGTVGGTAQLSGLDTVNVKYSHTQTEFARGSISSLFKMDTATTGWSRVLTPHLSAQLGGGGILINSRQPTYAANAALIMNFSNNSATLSYSHSAFPSFVGRVPIILVGEVFSLSAIQKIDRQWQLAETVNYSHRSGGSGLNALTFNSYRAGVDLYYWVTSIWSTALSYDYTKFNSEFGSVTNGVDRKVITLSVRAVWG